MRTVPQVAADLTQIETLYEALLVQAIHKAGDRLMPGGEAMVALAGVASPDEWAEQIAAIEMHHLATCDRLDHTRCRYAEHALDEDGAEPPLQTLLFWSEQWRTEAGYSLDRRPTIRTEANYIRGALNWAWENLVEWDDFAADIASARTRIENLLMAGDRVAVRGVPCMYDQRPLIKKLVPTRGEDGEKTWRLTDWHCPACKRQWSDDEYARNVTAANWRAQREDVEGEVWCSTKYAATHVGRPESTIRQWLHKGYLATVCIVTGRRERFVRLSDVEERDQTTGRRKRAA